MPAPAQAAPAAESANPFAFSSQPCYSAPLHPSPALAQHMLQLLWQQQMLQQQAAMVQQQLHMYTAGVVPQQHQQHVQHSPHAPSASVLAASPVLTTPNSSLPLLTLGASMHLPGMPSPQQAAWPAAPVSQPHQLHPHSSTAGLTATASWPSMAPAPAVTGWEELHSCYSLPGLPSAVAHASATMPAAVGTMQGAALPDSASGNPFL